MDVPAFDPTKIFQTVSKSFVPDHGVALRKGRQQRDMGDFRCLLRVRSTRPAGRGAAEKRNKFASVALY
jgi:hypothetical protein